MKTTEQMKPFPSLSERGSFLTFQPTDDANVKVGNVSISFRERFLPDITLEVKLIGLTGMGFHLFQREVPS